MLLDLPELPPPRESLLDGGGSLGELDELLMLITSVRDAPAAPVAAGGGAGGGQQEAAAAAAEGAGGGGDLGE
jgi:hypothetical protein